MSRMQRSAEFVEISLPSFCFEGFQIYIVTWNMNGRLPMGNMVKLFENAGSRHDLYVVGLQEAPSNSLEVCILDHLGKGYRLVAASVMLSLQLFIFVRTQMEAQISDIRIDKVGVGGLGGVVGRQKGAVAVSLNMKKTSLVFIACHLAPHEGNVEERNAQLWRIYQGVFSKHGSRSLLSCLPHKHEDHYSSDRNAIDESDLVIWLGDLNYRVEGIRNSVLEMITNNLEKLSQKDQLCRAVRQGHIFNGFQEGPLSFRPTYKYDIGSDNYDTSAKQRLPSWTDRILYKVKRGSRIRACVHEYDSIDALRTSDHRPVKALLHISNMN